jgi:diguanylate cyclase (GGDEF)-like protein
LILEDNVCDAELAVRQLRRAGIACAWQRVETETAFRDALRESPPDVILSDYSLPGFDGASALAWVVREAPDTPFIYVSGTIGEERAIDALKHGAVDYVLKTNLTRLAPAVRRALEEAASRRARRRAEERVGRLTRVLRMLSGVNAAVVRIRDRTQLLQEACRIAHEVGDYAFAFVALIDPRTRCASAVAWAGAGAEARDQARFPVEAADTTDVSVTGRALRTGQSVVCESVLDATSGHACDERRFAADVNCLASVSLLIDDTPVGALTVGAAARDAVDDEELRMLEEMAANISFALQYLHQENAARLLAYFDPLTGLAKRTLFCERLARVLGRHAGTPSPVVIVAFNIERLGLINDSLGRHTGDRVVRCVADGLKRQFGDAENVAHLEGGAFAVMIQGQKSYEDAVRLLQDHLTAVCGRPLEVAGRALTVNLKAGLAHFPEDGMDAESLLQNAEAALHQLRTSGDRYLLYRREMSAEVLERLALEQRVCAALEADQFVLHYQPQIELTSGAIVGAEALLRWRDPVRGLMAPEVFLSVLESTGRIIEVGEWVLRQAAADLRHWQALSHRPLRVAVNLSPVQLRQPDFAARFLAIAPSPVHGAGGLDVEITEGALLEDPTFLARTLQTLRDAGVSVAIDDFGTGYSSLSRLSQLPVDTLKIDRSFTSRLVGDVTAQAVVSTIVSLARAFALSTIAEGVETLEQAKLLESLGCEQSQGYLHSRPVPAEQFEALLSAP